MASHKGYELKITPSDVFLKVIPPESGEKAQLSDIQKYISKRGVIFRPEHLFDIYRNSSGEFEMLAKRESTKFEVVVELSPNEVEATMVIYPPTRGNDRLDPAKVKKAITKAGVIKGIHLEVVQKMVLEEITGREVVIAKGKAPISGKDGFIEFTINEDDPKGIGENIDYKELNLIRSVEEGEIIAKIIPPEEGQDGFTIKGEPVHTTAGSPATIKLGSNTTFSEDQNEVIATAPGFIIQENGKVSVEKVYKVADVNHTTGNINFAGVVMVTGAVEDNFSITAEKGIEIHGPVGRAKLVSKGDIIAHGGVMGANLNASGNVGAKFISESQVYAGNNVIVEEYILHSTVEAGSLVRVTKAPEGFINGGMTRAGEMVWTPNIGSEVEEKTQVDVGLGPALRKEFEDVKAEIERGKMAFDKARKNLNFLQQEREAKGGMNKIKNQQMDDLLQAAIGNRNTMWEKIEVFHRLMGKVEGGKEGRGEVFVVNTVHPGVLVQVRRRKFQVKSPLLGSAFKIVGNDLKIQDYDEAVKIYKMQYGKLPI